MIPLLGKLSKACLAMLVGLLKKCLSKEEKGVFQNGSYSPKCLDKLWGPPTEEEVAAETAMEAKAEPEQEVDMKLLSSMMTEFNVPIAAANSPSLPVRDTCLIVNNLWRSNRCVILLLTVVDDNADNLLLICVLIII